MSNSPHLVTLESTTVAVVRETVPMSELTAYFDRAFHAVMAAAEAQGVAIAGPPVAVYHGMPGESVDVAAGFPISAPVASAEGGVVASELPAGRAAQLLHVGSYDSLEQAYGRIVTWLGEQGLTPAEVMWESYLNEPDPDDPDGAETLITWPVA
jgi:effector-binding domain-containing protein